MSTSPIEAELIIFDLDGTLLDSSGYASKAVHQAFDKLIAKHPEIPKPTVEEITGQIGCAMQEFYKGLLPAEHQVLWEELHAHASAIERDFLASGADFLFEGIRETLSELKFAGKILAVASNCSHDYLDAIAQAYDFDRWFTRLTCVGRGDDITKSMLVQELVERFAPDGKALMVGDRVHDYEAARIAGIPFIGCRYGFASSQEWVGADGVIEAPLELLELVR